MSSVRALILAHSSDTETRCRWFAQAQTQRDVTIKLMTPPSALGKLTTAKSTCQPMPGNGGLVTSARTALQHLDPQQIVGDDRCPNCCCSKDYPLTTTTPTPRAATYPTLLDRFVLVARSVATAHALLELVRSGPSSPQRDDEAQWEPGLMFGYEAAECNAIVCRKDMLLLSTAKLLDCWSAAIRQSQALALASSHFQP